MTRDDILCMARSSGFKERNGIVLTMHSSGACIGINEEIERFAALVAAAEREAYTKECEVAQQTRQPLTDEQIKSMWRFVAIFGTNYEKAIALARAIEATHGIK